jgi:hypothetical protein
MALARRLHRCIRHQPRPSTFLRRNDSAMQASYRRGDWQKLSRTVCHNQQEPDPVSIASLQSNPWANPWAASSTAQAGTSAPTGPYVEINDVQASFSTSSSSQTAAGMSGASTSPANPLQSLAADIQAMLIQAQSAAATGATTAGTTQATTPEQSVAADLQALLGDIQGTVAGTATPNTQTANSNATAPTGETQPHHHHHHHEGGGEANGASDVAAASTSSGTSASTAGSQPASDQAVSSIFATDIAQAIQAYGGASTSAAMPALMV